MRGMWRVACGVWRVACVPCKATYPVVGKVCMDMMMVNLGAHDGQVHPCLITIVLRRVVVVIVMTLTATPAFRSVPWLNYVRG